MGELRFEEPTAPEPCTEPLDATDYGATALRISGIDNLIPESAVPGKAR